MKIKLLAFALSVLLMMSVCCLVSCEKDNGIIDRVDGIADGSGDDGNTVIMGHNVTYMYNDESGRSETIRIPEGGKVDDYDPVLVNPNCEFVGWSTEINGELYTQAVMSDLIVYAQWSACDPVVYTDEIPDTLSDRFVQIQLNDNAEVLNGKILKIAPSVSSLTIVGNSNVCNSFSIVIADRSEAFTVVLDDFGFYSNSQVGIWGQTVSLKYKVSLKVLGTCMIDATQFTNQGMDRGAECINVPDLDIYGNGALTLYAGNGCDADDKPKAGEGQDGEDGANGKNGGHCIVAGNVSVNNITLEAIAGNGGDGGDGGHGNNMSGILNGKFKSGGKGGNGGNGGAAFAVEKFYAYMAILNLKAGRGGNGGFGGDAGGSNISYAGNGGRGGNGGNGGNVFNTAVFDKIITGSVLNMEYGMAGWEGNGGDSAANSLKGKAGVPGKDGVTNIQY